MVRDPKAQPGPKGPHRPLLSRPLPMRGMLAVPPPHGEPGARRVRVSNACGSCANAAFRRPGTAALLPLGF